MSWDRKKLGSSIGLFGTNDDVRAYGVVQQNWSQFAPKVGLNFQATDDFLAYISASEGYRAGGFNGFASTPAPPNAFGAEKLWDYEGGIKTEIFHRRLRLNIGGFYYDYKNYQASVNQIVNGVISVITANAAALALYGAELEAEWRVTDAFNLSAYVTGQHSRFHDIVPGATASVRPDSQPPNAPKLTAGSSAEYRFDLGGNGSIQLRGDYAYKSATEFFLPNFPGEAQPGFGVLNARATYVGASGKYEVALFGTNILDKQYRVYAQSLAPSFGVTVASYAPPAEWGASLKVKF